MDYSEAIVHISLTGLPNELKFKFCRRYMSNKFSVDYSNNLGHDLGTKNVTIDNYHIKQIINNVNGEASFDKIRKGYYRTSSGLIITFEKDNRDSFEKVRQFFTEYREVRSSTPVFIVGIKTKKEEITKNEGEELATILGADYYEMRHKTTVTKTEFKRETDAFAQIIMDMTKEILKLQPGQN